MGQPAQRRPLSSDAARTDLHGRDWADASGLRSDNTVADSRVVPGDGGRATREAEAGEAGAGRRRRALGSACESLSEGSGRKQCADQRLRTNREHYIFLLPSDVQRRANQGNCPDRSPDRQHADVRVEQ